MKYRKHVGGCMKINKDIISRVIQGDTVLLNKITGDYFSLNAVGTDIYNCLINEMEVNSIVDCLVDKYDVNAEQLKSDVIALIENLKENEIVSDQ